MDEQRVGVVMSRLESGFYCGVAPRADRWAMPDEAARRWMYVHRRLPRRHKVRHEVRGSEPSVQVPPVSKPELLHGVQVRSSAARTGP